MKTDAMKVINAIDALTPIVELLGSMSYALRCETFDDAPMREGICVALEMGSEKLQNIVALLYDAKGERNTPSR